MSKNPYLTTDSRKWSAARWRSWKDRIREEDARIIALADAITTAAVALEGSGSNYKRQARKALGEALTLLERWPE